MGRLDAVEFNERMEKVLSARTQADIDELFVDLPDPRPAMPAKEMWPPPAPVTADNRVGIYDDARGEDPWYAQWWMILVAVGVTVLSRGNVGFIIPMMAVWLWVIYPSLSSTKNRRSRSLGGPHPGSNYTPPTFARSLSAGQRQQITGELDRGRRIHAIRLYRDFTGADLKEAKEAIDAWGRQIGY